MLAIRKNGGGNLGKKGFAISGMIYPILILTLFLIGQILFTFQSRKKILDREKNQLLDTVNKANEIYDLEKITTLLNNQQKEIDELKKKQSNMYPVGSIYISTKNENPENLYGGTWISFGTGRTLVGIDSNQTEFNTVEKLGGEKTHILSTDEMPAHTGHYNYWSNIGSGSADGYLLSVPKLKELGIMLPYKSRPWRIVASNELDLMTSSIGNSKAHNNLPPYITVYMWKRTE